MSKTSTDSMEKRQEKRFPINSTVSITVPGKKNPVSGTCCNISGNGLMIRTQQAIAVDKKVLVSISEGKIEFSAEALVIRCQADNDMFYLGIKVTNQLK